MRCPRCNLVHPDSETYCRRCEIDLRTGEPMPLLQVVETVPPGQRLMQLTETLPLSALAVAKRYTTGIKTFSGEVASKLRSLDWNSWTARVKALFARADTLKAIPCVQCEGEMKVEHIHDYGAGGFIALFILGVALIGLGFMAWPLFVTGAISIGFGVFFQRRGRSRWLCSSCGFKVPRH